MTDGTYDLTLNASAFSSRGEATVQRNRIEARDGNFRLCGTLDRRWGHMEGSFQVQLSPDAVGNTLLPPEFLLTASGTAGPSSFSILGAGPLGLIIEIKGELQE